MAGPKVVVVGLGPAGPDLVTGAALEAISHVPRRFVRTRRHPAADLVDGESFDDVYESAEHIDEVYRRVVEALVAAARAEGEVLYAVPGSPAVAERTVELLLEETRVAVEVVPALSFLDLAWVRLGADPVTSGARVVDGRRFTVQAAGQRGPLLVCQCDQPHVLSEVKLSLEQGPEVTVLQRLGTAEEAVTTVAWDDLDREVQPDHLTSLWIPELADPVASELVAFAELVRTLRAECPWDREQTHASLRRHVIEEAYEVAEAIDHLDADAGAGPRGGMDALEEELGDLLFQVVFHSTLAAETGDFTLADVARGIHQKLVRRHPHVFADARADTAEAVVGDWEQIKRTEKERGSVFEGIPATLPAVLYARKVLKKARSIGFEPDSDRLDRAIGDVESAEATLRAVADDVVDEGRRAERAE